VYASLKRLKVLDASDYLERIKVIVVDEYSTDASAKMLEKFREEHNWGFRSEIQRIFIRHEKNGGKGKAIKTALDFATCEISVIHDADLEYHPKDLLRIVRVFGEASDLTRFVVHDLPPARCAGSFYLGTK
jgi:glycosyltransferase involved in cell wall biosynthesis